MPSARNAIAARVPDNIMDRRCKLPSELNFKGARRGREFRRIEGGRALDSPEQRIECCLATIMITKCVTQAVHGQVDLVRRAEVTRLVLRCPGRNGDPRGHRAAG